MSLAITEDVQKNLMNTNELRIVLVGKTGVGKSATGNTILQKKAFKSEVSSSSVTSDCEKAKAKINDRTVAVIDTPGLFDTAMTEEEVVQKIKLCISMCAPGPHVIVVVLQVGRFTNEEQETLDIIKYIFKDSSAYTMVLFTHGDLLDKNNTTITEYINKSDKLIHFIESTSKLYHVFNNEEDGAEQVHVLLELIDQLIRKNDGQHYTNEDLQAAEREIQEEQNRLQREYQLDAEEARERAERNNAYVKAAAGLGAALAVGIVATVAHKGKCTIQ